MGYDMLPFNHPFAQALRRVGGMAAGLCANRERAGMLAGAHLSDPDSLALTPSANHTFADAFLHQIKLWANASTAPPKASKPTLQPSDNKFSDHQHHYED